MILLIKKLNESIIIIKLRYQKCNTTVFRLLLRSFEWLSLESVLAFWRLGWFNITCADSITSLHVTIVAVDVVVGVSIGTISLND